MISKYRFRNLLRIVKRSSYPIDFDNMYLQMYQKLSFLCPYKIQKIYQTLRFSQQKINKLHVHTLLCFDIHCTKADAYVYHFYLLEYRVFLM